MALTPGARLGPYEITGTLGAGGMGEVYRATDTNLKRAVAIKVLPESVANDRERLARFQREAELLASLNHPNIAAIYGLERSNGVTALVMELVEGPTLADRIAQGPIPVDEALPIAKQIAEALEAAHEQGIIHRDLKPANIKVRPDGTVKVLDFGLAKALEPVSAAGMDATASPTITSPAIMTGVGMLLGTAAYMSPEQAKGRPVDKRSDIWAFGCVLYEMLAGRAAFPGGNISEVLAGVIKSDVAWDALPPNTPPKVHTLLRRCFQKDPNRRLRHIGDARLELEEVFDAPEEPVVAAPTRARAKRERLAWSIAAIAVIAALTVGSMAYIRSTPTDRTPFYSSILPPAGVYFAPAVVPPGRFALSPDGRRLVFVGSEDPLAARSGGAGGTRLWVQAFDGRPPQLLAGTEGAQQPFWSPDSRFIGFRADSKVKVIEATGGPVLTLADTVGTNGGTWNQDGVILFATTGGTPIRRVPASGGEASPVTTIDTVNGETQHWYPFFLPDDRHFLYLAIGSKTGGPASANGIYVAALDSSERKLLVRGGSNPMYAQGYLLFVRAQALMAQPFDVDRLELTGDAMPIAEGVAVGGSTAIPAGFTVSQAGVLAYQTGAADAGGGSAAYLSRLAWFDRRGNQTGLLGEQARSWGLDLDPNGSRVAVSLLDPARRTTDIWIFDIARGLRTRFTFDPEHEFSSVWSADGSRVVFSTARKASHYDLYQRTSSGAGSEEELLVDDRGKVPHDWSPDGRFVLFSTSPPNSDESDLWLLPVSGDRKPFPFLQTPFTETLGQFSPDGRWIAYVSNESGRNEVYVAPFHDPGGPSAPTATSTTAGKWQVSTAGGNWPRWRRDGREIFYLAPDTSLMAAAVNGQGSAFQVGASQRLFLTRAIGNQSYMYDVSANGQRILVNTLAEDVTPSPITVVLDWTLGLKR